MIGVLGGGQLGRMLALAGIPLGYRFVFLEPGEDPPAADVGEVIAAPYDDPDGLATLAGRCDIVTYEFENVPAAAAARLKQEVPVWPPDAALGVAQDREEEKRLFTEVGLEVPEYRSVSTPDELDTAIAQLGLPVVVKTRREGYDGKGQVVVRSEADAGAARALVEAKGCLVERMVPFDRELSLVAVRSRDGEVRSYPLVENTHREGILRTTIAPAPQLKPRFQDHAEEVAGRILERLGYVGVLAIELFVVGERLLGNEMAPRVHNSGHWSIEGAAASQFENHIRAVAGLPLGDTAARGDWVMLNIIGDPPDVDRLLDVPDAHLHLYRKAPRPGRKLGHVTAPLERLDELTKALEMRPSGHGST